MEIKKQRTQKIALFRRVLCASRALCACLFLFLCKLISGPNLWGLSRAWVLGMALPLASFTALLFVQRPVK